MPLLSQTLLNAGSTIRIIALQTSQNRVPTTYTITTGGASTPVGSVTVNVTALTVALDGQEILSFGGVTVALTSPVSAGATVLPCLPTTTAIPANATATTLALQSILGCEDLNLQTKSTNIDTTAFESGYYEDGRIAIMGITIPIQGHAVQGNIGYSIIKNIALLNPAQEIYAQVIYPDGEQISGAWGIENFQQMAKVKDIRKFSATLMLRSTPTSYTPPTQTASGGVTVNPIIYLTSPARQAVLISSPVTLAATASVGAGTILNVQFQVNGSNQGAPDTTVPYSVTYTTPAVNGTISVGAIATASGGGITIASPLTLPVLDTKVIGAPSAPTTYTGCALTSPTGDYILINAAATTGTAQTMAITIGGSSPSLSYAPAYAGATYYYYQAASGLFWTGTVAATSTPTQM